MMVILGSASPRRKELLSPIVNSFRIEIADIDEKEIPGEGPLEHCCRLAEEKGAAIRKRLSRGSDDTMIITSDTIVTAGSRILGKPEDRQGAEEMIKFLSGKTHRVITAITLSVSKNNDPWQIITESEITTVTFKDLSDEEINSYLDSIHYMDKAGSYAIQENGEMIIEAVKGSESNVIGFPLELFEKMLKELNLQTVLNKTKAG